MSTTGRWSETGFLPFGKIEWIKPIKGGIGRIVGIVSNKAIFHARKVQGGFSCSIEGWQWKVTPDMNAAKFNQIPGDKIEFISYKFFKRLSDAKKEAECIYATLPKRMWS